MWRGSRGAGCSTSANPRPAAPRPAPCCDGAVSHGATYSQRQAGPQADKAAPVDLLLRSEVAATAPAPALSTSVVCGR